MGPLEVAYDERVLAPRPWTLEQASWGAGLWRDGPVLELCSGVGHIGLALAAQVPAPLVLVDANPVACDFAWTNAAAAGLGDRVEIRCAQLDDGLLPDERFGLVLADPPWVPSDGVGAFPDDPVFAIDGGADGLDLVRACVAVIGDHLADDGSAVLQVGPGQAAAVRRMGLRVVEERDFGQRGALLLLRRV